MELAAPAANMYEGYTYAQFKSEFGNHRGLKLGSPLHDEHEAIFNQNLATIREHNSGGHSWKLGVNKFADMSQEELSRFLGYDKNAAREARAGRRLANYDHVAAEDVPSEVDWRDAGVVTAAKDQGGCGSCWAFSGTESIESHLAIATGELLELSPQLYVSCAPNPDSCGGTGGCQGSTMELLFNYSMTAGAVLESDYPYKGITGTCQYDESTKVATVEDYVQNGQNSYSDLVNAVATVGPVSITVDASKWFLYSSGIYDPSVFNSDLDHGVQLVGFGTDEGSDYWLVRNSWGGSWGESGYIRLAKSDDDESNCGTDSNPGDGVACAGDNDPETVCGTCGILYDTSYPVGVSLA